MIQETDKSVRRVFYSKRQGRVLERVGRSVCIYWNQDMLDFLRRHYATTLNEELAGCLGVSLRTVIRKARELGLEKDPAWLRSVYEERRQLAQHTNRRNGNPMAFTKGHSMTAEQKRKHVEGMKRWYRMNPGKAKAKALKAAATRRRQLNQAILTNQNNYNYEKQNSNMV